MADDDRNDRTDRPDRPRQGNDRGNARQGANKGASGGGKKYTFRVDGTPKATNVSVRVVEKGKPVAGATISFRYGDEANPARTRLCRAGTDDNWTITTGPDGYAIGIIDCSRLGKGVTHLTAIHEGWDETKPIPIQTEGEEPKSEKGTLEIEAEAAVVPDAYGDLPVTVKTRRDGNLAAREVRVMPSVAVLLDEHKRPVQNFTTPESGVFNVYGRMPAGVSQASIKLVLDNGKETVIDLVKVMTNKAIRRSRS